MPMVERATQSGDYQIEVLKRVGTLFVSRRDAYATESRGGEWFLARERGESGNYDGPPIPMGRELLLRHLAGDVTVGHYLVDPSTDTAKVLAFDIDLGKSGYYMPYSKKVLDLSLVHGQPLRSIWNSRGSSDVHEGHQFLECLLSGVAEQVYSVCRDKLRSPVLVADSGGKGVHVYVLPGAQPAAMLREVGSKLLESIGWYPTKGNNFWTAPGFETTDPDGKPAYQVTIEVFPKQASVGADGFGNLMRLPCGLHARTRRRFSFLDMETEYVGWPNELDPLKALPEV
jgi:hypothetical protein